MGFEPTTTCLEGKSSTTELHPHGGSSRFQVPGSKFVLNLEPGIWNLELQWVGRDLNPRIPKEPDLQSGAIDRSAIRPWFAPELPVGIEPTAYGLQNRCTTVVLR